MHTDNADLFELEKADLMKVLYYLNIVHRNVPWYTVYAYELISYKCMHLYTLYDTLYRTSRYANAIYTTHIYSTLSHTHTGPQEPPPQQCSAEDQ